MKAKIIQPLYCTDFARSDEMFKQYIDAMDNCDPSVDILVLPESCDVPCLAGPNENFHVAVAKYAPVLMEKAKETAKRCDCVVFYNASDTRYENTTFAINRQGEVVGRYFKTHPVNSEIFERGREGEYSYEFDEPYTVEIDGIKYGFLTCYDFYFYEMFHNIARQNVDVIIGCSHQRSDTFDALETMTKFLAYNTNSHVLRSSVSMGLDSPLGGCSMAVAPTGRVLANMHSEVGAITVEFDPHDKYYKPAGYGSPLSAHWEYVEAGRRPWKYRQGGSGIVRFDKVMKYPRLCAHRGFNTIAPENSMPAYGAAVAMGADEIEFDIWATADGVLVSLHDFVLDRVSDGRGAISDRDLAYVKNCDFGSVYAPEYAGLKCPTFEEILKQFSGRVVMNIHVKIWAMMLLNPDQKIDPKLEEIAALIRKYDCEKHCYFMSSNTEMLLRMRELLPNAGYCRGAEGGNAAMVEAAIENGFDKVQFVKDSPFDKSMIDRCHDHGIRCNIFWSDDVAEARTFLHMGFDTVLTNDYQRIYEGVKDLLPEKQGYN